MNIQAFCRKTGYSREHATRELSSIRREEPEFEFETKQRAKGRSRQKRWGVMVSQPQKLRFDRHSLFFDQRGRYLHTYNRLGTGRLKLAPPILPQARGNLDRENGQNMAMEPGKDCDNSDGSEGGCAPQQTNSNGAAGRSYSAKSRGHCPQPGAKDKQPLRKKAFSLLAALKGMHWDNCKVRFNRRTAFAFLYRALCDGHEVEKMLAAYEKALNRCHAFACDRSASRGEVCYFNLSSTVSHARRELANDGLTRDQRVRQWYQRQQSVSAADAASMTSDELHQAMAKSLGLKH